MTALLAVVFTSCEKDKTPAWYTNAKTNFGNGLFVPEMRDIVPGSMLGTTASTVASAKFAGISTKSVDDYQTLLFSDIKGAHTDGIQNFLATVANWRIIMLDLKKDILGDFERRDLTQQNVWVDVVKYEENNQGKFVYWKRKPDTYTEYAGAKLSMYGDGANEIYFFEKRWDADQEIRLYSYLKDDKYIFVSANSEGFWYLSSDTKNGIKKGNYLNVNFQYYSISTFEGDVNDFVNHILHEQVREDQSIYKAQSAYSIINGVICPYNDIRLDLRAFDNINEIYYEKKGPKWYDLQGIKLKDGTIIDDNLPGNFDFQEAEEFVEIEGGGGQWGTVPANGFSIGLNLDFSGGTSKLSDGIPAALRQLQLSAGFDNLYTDLQSESAGYFSNFYLTEFSPLASSKINLGNTRTIINTMSTYMETHHAGF
jgi:hypothetical protein